MRPEKPSPRDRAVSPASDPDGTSGYAEEQPDDKAEAQQSPPKLPPEPEESDLPDDSGLPAGPPPVRR